RTKGHATRNPFHCCFCVYAVADMSLHHVGKRPRKRIEPGSSVSELLLPMNTDPCPPASEADLGLGNLPCIFTRHTLFKHVRYPHATLVLTLRCHHTAAG